MKLPYISRKAHQAKVDSLQAEIAALKAPNVPERMKGKQEYVFTDAEGRKYYQYANPTDMPYLRAVKTQEILRYAEMNLTREVLDQYFTSIETHFNQGLIGKGMHEFVCLMKRSNLKTDIDVLYELAAVIYIRQDEDPGEYSPTFCAEKIAYWRTQSDIVNFILAASFRELWNCGKMSDADILNFLNQTKEELRELEPLS